jgi:hypothetical protein
MATKNITAIVNGDKFRWGTVTGDDRCTATGNAFAVSPDEIVVNCTRASDGAPAIHSGRPDMQLEVPGW